jgi:hypothetical protein
MPRRYWDYDPMYTIFHQLSTIGAFVLGISMFISVVNLLVSFKKGRRAPRNPWGGTSLEWQAPTPPPLYNFENPPVLHELYNYDDLVEVEEDRWERRAPIEVKATEAPGHAHEHAKPANPTPPPPADIAEKAVARAEKAADDAANAVVKAADEVKAAEAAVKAAEEPKAVTAVEEPTPVAAVEEAKPVAEEPKAEDKKEGDK